MFLSRNLQELERLLRPEKQILSALSLITHKASPRRPAGDIAREELTRLLRREIKSGIRDFFGDDEDRDESRQGAGASDRDRSRNGEALSGQKFMEAAFDEMVAGAILRGRRTSGVLSALFDLVPTLAGR